MTIFADQAATLAELRGGKLALLPATYVNGAALSDMYLWNQVLSAEEEVSRRLAVPLEPTRVFSVGGPTSDELTELGDSPYLVEPGYDGGGFEGLWQWDTLQLNTRPLISVQEVKFVYPGLNETVYVVPPDWIYPDAKSAILQFTAAPTAGGLPGAIVAMNVFTLGRTVPQMIRVKYTAGLTPRHPTFRDVRNLVLRMAVLRILLDAFIPQSGSISADGLSQSTSMDTAKYQEAIDADLENLRERINGLMFGVL
jgi:hypothetical protein